MSLYEVLKASKTERFPDYWTLLWGRKMSASMIKTITGVLPLTFTAKGGNAVDWEIEGNTQGVGERTKNLLEITAYNRSAQSVRVNDISAVRGYVSTTGGGEVNWEKIFWRPPLEYGKTYILSLNVVSSTSAHYMAISDVSGRVVYNLALRTTGQKTAVINYTQSSFPNGIKLDAVLTMGNAPTDPSTLVMSDMMLVEGSTAPQTYIPYGYQIPLTVSRQGQTDKTVDIYIGDSPLTEGETVSKTSTGVDIELFEGENTVSTTLYNKPAMKIKYK